MHGDPTHDHSTAKSQYCILWLEQIKLKPLYFIITLSVRPRVTPLAQYNDDLLGYVASCQEGEIIALIYTQGSCKNSVRLILACY